MATRGGFEGDVGFAEDKLRAIAGRTKDIARNLERASSIFANFGAIAAKADKKLNDIASTMERMNRAGDRNGFEKMNREFKKMSTWKSGMKVLDSMDKGFQKITSSILKLGSGLISGVFTFLVSSIKRVYELQERWTQAIGGFNMKIGGMTAGLKGAQKAATQWSSTIRGLTDGDINEGIQMFGEFTFAMSQVIKKGDEFSKFGIQMARGFNLGGEGAGRLTRTFKDMGMSSGMAVKTMDELTQAANLVGVPVNQLAEDVLEANTYMARFGKEGARGFVTAAGYARKFGIAMKELQAATEKFDTFDESANAAAKLNATFGTLINSVDMMLMDDPAQRMEYMRQQFLAQGKTYDALSVKERRYAAETMGVNDQQLASLLSMQNAQFSYSDMMEKQIATEATEAKAKRNMELQLRKTAQTMYSFGMAFDEITVAIAKAIQPLLEVLGLAKSGGKEFTSFGQVMKSITAHVVYFFESLAKNPKWTDFMKELAKGMIDVGKAIGSFIMDGRAAKWAGELAGFLHEVYDWGKKAFSFMLEVGKLLAPVLGLVVSHMKEAAMIWVGLQAVKLAGGVASNYNSIKEAVWSDNKVINAGGAAGASGGAAGAAGGMTSPWGTGSFNAGGEATMDDTAALHKQKTRRRSLRRHGYAGAGAAAAIGIATGGGGIGASVGGGLGTMIGGIFGGPLGAAVGGALGGFLGDKVSGLLSSIFSSKLSPLDVARKHLSEAMKSASEAASRNEQILNYQAKKGAREDKIRSDNNSVLDKLEKEAGKTKKGLNFLSEEESKIVRKRAQEFVRMGINVNKNVEVLRLLNDGSGLTNTQIRNLSSSANDYEKELIKMRESTALLVKQQIAELEGGDIARKKARLDFEVSETEALIATQKDFVKKIENNTVQGGFNPQEFEEYLKANPLKAVQASESDAHRAGVEKQFALIKQKKKLQDLEEGLAAKQLALVNAKSSLDKELFFIQARAAIMGTGRFQEYSKQNSQMFGGNENAILNAFLGQHKKEYQGEYGDRYKDLLKPMAAGGIVSSPTRALIGENGAEAVIPLRALARGKGPGGSRGLGGPLGKTLANLATGGGGGRTQVHVVTSDVIMDSVKVGRAITKIAISTSEA